MGPGNDGPTRSLSTQNRNVRHFKRMRSQNSSSSSGQEQALYVLLAATGMRISEALALETHHFTNSGRTIVVEQQVEKDAARIVKYLKTAAAEEKSTCTPTSQSTCDTTSRKELDCCFTRQTTRRIFMAIWKTAGSLHDSSRWVWTRKEWAGTRSSDSVKRGCVVNAVWKTSTTSGWRTSRKPCPNSIRIFTRNCSYASMKPSESATDSFFRRRIMPQLYRLYRKRTKKCRGKCSVNDCESGN